MNEELNDVLSMDDFEAVSQMEMGQQEESTEESLPGIDAGAETETAENAEPVKGNKLQERLDKLTSDKYAEKRRADELAARLAQMEASNQGLLPEGLVEPEMPADIWDEGDMRKYHKDMAVYNRKVAAYEARQVYSSTQQQKAQQEQQIEQQKIARAFAKRAIDSGLTTEQVEQAGTMLVDAGLSQELQMLLLEDEAGPQITIHLAKNPDLAFELIGMPLHKAAIKLATQIKAEAAGTKPRVSQAPDPIPSGRSASMKETDDLERQFKNSKFI